MMFATVSFSRKTSRNGHSGAGVATAMFARVDENQDLVDIEMGSSSSAAESSTRYSSQFAKYADSVEMMCSMTVRLVCCIIRLRPESDAL